ncbi:MAG: hypothetical protein ACK481_07490 [Candidatus Melainabacteria bacterium]|nr:hypothetical protein [Aphanizomenon flos-aquae CP01]
MLNLQSRKNLGQSLGGGLKRGFRLNTIKTFAIGFISLSLLTSLIPSSIADVVVGGSITNGTATDLSNVNQIGLQNASTNQNQINVQQRASIIGNGAGGAVTNTVMGSPSAFASTHLHNGPWNFTPPQILFDASKTINDGSIFNCCRIVNVGAKLRKGIKDRLFGIYDEREYIAAGVGGGMAAYTGGIVACGINTQLPSACVTYIGSGHVFMEEYASTEAALVSLSRMAAKNGANVVGNVNCAFAETVRSYSTGVGGAIGGADASGENGSVSGSLGANWATSRVKRPVQTHCSGDFYMGNASNCYALGMNQTYFPQPRPYKRYLPPPPNFAPPASYQEPVRGLW